MKPWFTKLFVTKTDQLLIQLFRYTFVAGIGLVVDFGVLYLLTTKFGVYYLLSASISFLLALLVNYFLSVAWIFDSTRDKLASDLAMFGIIGLVGLGLNVGLIWVFTEWFGLYYLYSKVCSTVLVYFWNFLMRRYFVFKAKPADDQV